MRVLTIMVTLVVVALGGPAAALAETPAEVSRTNAAVQKNASDILKFAYPTARSLNAAPIGKWDSREGGYVLDETFDYDDSDRDEQSFTLRFNLDDNGLVRSFFVLRQSEIWPPFGTADLVLEIFKAAAQDELDKARREGRDPPPAAVAIRKARDFKVVISVMLNLGR